MIGREKGQNTEAAAVSPYLVNFPTGQRNQVHHSYIWLSSLVALLGAGVIALISNIGSLVPLVIDYVSNAGSVLIVLAIALLAAFVLYCVILLISYLAYKNLSYVFDEKEFSLYSGIITKRRVHVPYARVQSVNHKQSLVQRIAGVCTVEVDTAGGAANKAVKVPYVQLGTGEAIRHDLFVRKAAGLAGAENLVVAVSPDQMAATSYAGEQAYLTGMPPMGAPIAPGAHGPDGTQQAQGNVLDEAFGGIAGDFRGVYGEAVAGMEPVSFERRLDNKELMLASVSHSGVSGAVVGFLAMVSAGVVPLAMEAPQLGLAGIAIIPFAILAFVLFVAASIVAVALSFGNFAVRRRGSRVEVERGLLQRDFSGIDVDRIQSLVIRQSFVRRLLGYCEVSLGRISAGSGDEQNTQAKLNEGGLVVHPFLKIDQVDGLLAQLLPEYSDRPVAADFKGLPDVALRRGMLRRIVWRNGLFWMVVFVAVWQIVFNLTFVPSLQAFDTSGAALARYVNLACMLLYALFVIQIPFVVVGTLWWKRGSGFAANRGYLALCNDGLSTETVYLPRPKVQDVSTRTNPFQRMSGVTTIHALCAAGVSGTNSTLWDVTEEDGAAWLDWLKPRVNVVQ